MTGRRPKATPLPGEELKRPDLSARALLTEKGYVNAVVWVAARLCTEELTRDETSALLGARKCFDKMADVRLEREQRKAHTDLVGELGATRAALKTQGSGGTTGFTSDQVQLPRKPGKGSTRN